MADARRWLTGIADEAAGIAKRAVGEFTARPDLVMDGEKQQAQGRTELDAAVDANNIPTADRVIGWKLNSGQRLRLIDRFPPHYANTVADHVTLASHVPPNTPPPPSCSARIVGQADDGAGVQALVVAIDGTTQRPDGGTFHITWSLGPTRRAAESNDVLARSGWEPLSDHEEVQLHPASF